MRDKERWFDAIWCLLFFFFLNSKLCWAWVLDSQQIGLKTEVTTNRKSPRVSSQWFLGLEGTLKEGLVHFLTPLTAGPKPTRGRGPSLFLTGHLNWCSPSLDGKRSLRSLCRKAHGVISSVSAGGMDNWISDQADEPWNLPAPDVGEGHQASAHPFPGALAYLL